MSQKIIEGLLQLLPTNCVERKIGHKEEGKIADMVNFAISGLPELRGRISQMEKHLRDGEKARELSPKEEMSSLSGRWERDEQWRQLEGCFLEVATRRYTQKDATMVPLFWEYRKISLILSTNEIGEIIADLSAEMGAYEHPQNR